MTPRKRRAEIEASKRTCAVCDARPGGFDPVQCCPHCRTYLCDPSLRDCLEVHLDRVHPPAETRRVANTP